MAIDATADRDAPRIALTGATGFLGSHIADRLLSAGYRVRASIRTASSLRWISGKDIEPLRVDLTSDDDCARLVAGCVGVVHCAGVTGAASADAFDRGNVETTRALLAAARRTCPGSTFILISSLAAHGPAAIETPATETDADRPISAYGRSKLAAEQLVLAGDHDLRAAVLRPPGLYGPRDRDFLPLFKVARHGWTVRVGDRLQGLSLVDGRDAAAAAVALLDNPGARGVYYADDGKVGYSPAEMTSALAAAVGRRVRSVYVPISWLRLAAGLLGDSLAARSPILNRDRLGDLTQTGWVCSGERLRRDTGFKARRNAALGFGETFAAYRREGWL